MKGNGKLSKRQMQALPHILSAPSYEAAAIAARISTKQIYTWLKDPHFKLELDKRREQLMETAINTLITNTAKAALALASLLDSPNDFVKRGAANDILTQTLKLREMFEFEKRLDTCAHGLRNVQVEQEPRSCRILWTRRHAARESIGGQRRGQEQVPSAMA